MQAQLSSPVYIGARLLTDPIFLDRIPDPDPFEKLDLILHSDPLAFSGLAIRSDLPIHLGFKGPSMCFLFAYQTNKFYAPRQNVLLESSVRWQQKLRMRRLQKVGEVKINGAEGLPERSYETNCVVFSDPQFCPCIAKMGVTD
jgi:hypothetical protein